jgi:hypothetical protein
VEDKSQFRNYKIEYSSFINRKYVNPNICIALCSILFLFQNSKDPLMSQIYDKLVAPYENSLPVDDIEGIEHLCSIRNYALASHTFNLINLGRIPNCTITALPEAFFPASVAVAFSENSPYKEVFSQM